MNKREWPHQITIYYELTRARELLTWLHEQGLVLHDTVKFGNNSHKTGSAYITQMVAFKDPSKAMMFKLAWGGK